MLLFLSLLLFTAAFYLPGVAPKDYKEGDKVPLLVNVLTSSETGIPFDYYFGKFHFCGPESPSSQSESLGSILSGDRLFTSSFELAMMTNATCVQLCSTTIPKSDATFINEAISEAYMINWLIDGLPAAQTNFMTPGFQLGQLTASGQPALHNHYEITIHYHQERNEKYRIVGASVSPYSIASTGKTNPCHDLEHVTPLILKDSADTSVSFSYGVAWKASSIQWGTRWDHYLYSGDERIHWFSVINSACVLLLLSGMVSMILLRALRKDIARYNDNETLEDAQEEFGWKIVHGDVFRSPSYRMIFSVLIGNGVQLAAMALVTIVFAALGFLSPSSRGSVATMMIVFYVLFGCLSGYVSARFYKMFGGQAWRQNVLLSSCLVPGIIFGIFIFLNFFLVYLESSSSVPFTTMLTIMALWFFFSLPLALGGAYFGFKKQPMYLQLIPSILLAGILPFGACFIELFFIMNSLWANRVYYVFGFLALVFVMMVMTCSLVSILLCYFMLCGENYHWWWRSFLASGMAGFYMFLYSAFYFSTQLEIHEFAPVFIYFGWSLVTSTLFGILTGTVGFLATFTFVKIIYGSIKID